MLTLLVSVLREFLKLIAWKKGLSQAQVGDVVSAQKPQIKLCLENHVGLNMDENFHISSAFKSNIHYDQMHNSVDFALTVVLDSAHIPHVNAACDATWLLYCVSVRLRYSFGESPNVSFLGMEGSHGDRACWLRVDDWEKCARSFIFQFLPQVACEALRNSRMFLKFLEAVLRTGNRMNVGTHRGDAIDIGLLFTVMGVFCCNVSLSACLLVLC